MANIVRSSVEAGAARDAGERGSAPSQPANMDRPNSFVPLKLGQPRNPYLALGLAVDHLMAKPAYASMKFSPWSKILAGQINRGHIRFVLGERNRVKGMLGWAYADRELAERWVTAQSGDIGDGRSGDCVIFNLWSSDSPETTALVLAAARNAMTGRETLYFRRLYRDGRIRPVRLAVNEFVGGHLARATSRLHESRTQPDLNGVSHG